MASESWKIRSTVQAGLPAGPSTATAPERYATVLDATIAACCAWSAPDGRAVLAAHVSDDTDQWVEVSPTPCCGMTARTADLGS